MSSQNQKPKRNTSDAAAHGTRRLIVGIGASAGAIEAVEAFLNSFEQRREVAAKMTIVFVQPVDPKRDSLSAQRIEQATSMNVVAIEKTVKLKPGTIFIAPPHAQLEIKKGSVRVASTDSQATFTAIDDFLHSLAEEQATHAVGVILLGTGSDGTLGLKAISDAGGLTFAQTVDSAKHEGMPQSAAMTGVADHVLSPADIAKELGHYVAYLEDAATSTRLRMAADVEAAIPDIANLVAAATGQNFKHYKTSTLLRRIQRRMLVLRIADADTYLSLLKEDAEEPQVLFRELLISVTEFFRDEEAFELLAKNVIPKIFADRKSGDHVRLWVAGCATGEEAYSLAILCREQMDRMDDPPEVQIFATDIDQRALRIGRKGRYPIGIKDDISPERLKRYFKTVNKQYEVAKSIRELVFFSAHNLISDPPLSKLDLISCRNLLTYLGPHLQKKLIPLFHYALRPNAFLFLGPSENIASHGDLFEKLDSKWRISQRKTTGVAETEALSFEGSANRSPVQEQTAPSPASMVSDEQDLLQVMQRIVLDEFSPRSVVVDEQGQILCASSDMRKYLTVGTGNFQNNIIKMAREGLQIGLRATLQEARTKRRRIVHDDLSVKVDGNLQRVMITVQPMPRIGEDAELFMVIFHDSGLPLTRTESDSKGDSESKDQQANQIAASGTKTVNAANASGFANVGDSNDAIIAHLERELEVTRADLGRSVHDVETANEELRAANEELISLNEELQAVNEELETSKEEIQSSSDALSRSNTDLENLLRSTQIATIFLDEELNIRKFTPAATEIYGLREGDIGRPLAQLMPLADKIPPLPPITELDHEHPVEHSFKTHSGKWFHRRVLPYTNQRGEASGVVVTFVDVTTAKIAQVDASRRERQLRTLTDNTPALIAYIDADQRYQFINAPYASQFKQTPDDLVGKSVLEVLGEENFIEVEEALDAALGGEPRVFEMELKLDYLPNPLTKEVTYVPDFESDGLVSGCYVLVVDITERKQWEQTLQDRESYLRQVIDNIVGFVGILDVDGTLRDANQAATLSAGIAREDVIGKPFWECYWWAHDDSLVKQLRNAIARAASGDLVRYDVEVRMANDTRMMIDFMIAPVKDDDGKVTHLIPSGVDIGDRVEAQERAIRRQQQLNLATEVGRLGSWTWDIPSNTISWSDPLHELYGYSREEFNGSPEAFLEITVPEDRPIVESVINEVLTEGSESIEYECRSTRGFDGQIIWSQIRGAVDRDAEGIAYRVTGFATDITARKRRELSLEFLAALQAELADLVFEDDIVRAATARTAEFLNLTHCVLIDIDENAKTADVFYDHRVEGAPNLCGIHNMAEFWSEEDRALLAAGETVAIADTSDPSRPGPYAESFKRFGVGAIVNAPSVKNQKLDFIISSLKAQPWQWQAEEIELLRQLSTSLYLRIERARAESELKASKDQLLLGMEVANFAMGHVDYVSNRVMLSADAAKLYGLGDEPTVVSRDEIHATFHPDDREQLDECIQASLDPFGDGRISVEHRIICPDGRTVWLNVRKQVIFDRSVEPPRPAHAILVAQDYTQRKESESALEEARAMAELASKSKSEFLANMSHEIRTPMSAILGYADILNRHLKDPDNLNCVSIIRSNGQFLLEIINDILDISKIEAGKLELNQSEFHVDKLVADVQSLMSVRANEKEIDFAVRFTSKIPETIYNDDKRLKQVLVNLVGNAIKFTEVGGVTISIGLEQSSPTSQLKFNVIDTGIGMSPDQTGKLFQPFTQADTSVDRRFGGTGLGLTISQRLARMLNGHISFESELGVGSTFTLTLEMGDLNDVKFVDHRLPTPTADIQSLAKNDNQKPRLSGRYLIVDDRREIRFIAQHFIEDAGGEVMTAENGQEAIKIVAAGMSSFETIVMDMQMPVIDGYEAARRLRSLGFKRPIIALTAHAMDGDRDACIEAGCTDYISKPLDGPKFVALLASYSTGVRSS